MPMQRQEQLLVNKMEIFAYTVFELDNSSNWGHGVHHIVLSYETNIDMYNNCPVWT